jgi:hypothetical protein
MGAASGLTIVDTRAALAGRPAVIGALPAGVFPRELSVVAARARVLVTSFRSDQLEVVDTSEFP